MKTIGTWSAVLYSALSVYIFSSGQAMPYTLAVPGSFAFPGPLKAAGSYAMPQSFSLREPLVVPRNPGVAAAREPASLPQTLARPDSYAKPEPAALLPQTLAVPGSFWR
ncbi:MAG: hypothetical protein PHU21_04775 [Elusimicrobia bacterium]|nr:hypothetical protein [Elusimicrobiota bacterium]